MNRTANESHENFECDIWSLTAEGASFQMSGVVEKLAAWLTRENNIELYEVSFLENQFAAQRANIERIDHEEHYCLQYIGSRNPMSRGWQSNWQWQHTF